MHNPLKLLFKDALDELKKLNYVYYVRQTYERGKTGALQEAFLITPYLEKEHADKHFNAIEGDQRRMIYDISNPLHEERLYNAATQPEGYRIYLNRLRDREWQPDVAVANSCKNYIKRVLKWPMKSGIDISLGMQFGELTIKFDNGSQNQEIPLKEVEKY